MTFIIHFKDGHRETYNNRYDEDVEHERVESSIELGFNAKKRCHFCGKPVVEGSEYCKEHKEYMEERQCQR